MTIDDELVLEIIRPDSEGNIGENAPILKIIDDKDVWYALEESTTHTITYGSRQANQVEVIKMTPDIILAKKEFTNINGEHVRTPKNGITTAYGNNLAIELENDIQWDFQSSLKQLKKYKINFLDTRIIIPKDYERFASLYKNEGFRVYLWKAERIWQCLKCEAATAKEGPIFPKCSGCGTHGSNDFRLIGLKNLTIEESV